VPGYSDLKPLWTSYSVTEPAPGNAVVEEVTNADVAIEETKASPKDKNRSVAANWGLQPDKRVIDIQFSMIYPSRGPNQSWKTCPVTTPADDLQAASTDST
jgi:hypothetical protein